MGKNNNIEKYYLEYVNDVYRYSMFKLKNREEAEDVTSETFLNLLKSENLESVDNKKAWIITIARNIINNKYKLQTRSSKIIGDEIIDEFQDVGKQIENIVIDEEMINLVRSKLNEIDEESQEVIILRIWEELQFNEIAGLLKEDVNTVKLRFYRGIEKLKAELGEKKKGKKFYSITLPFVFGAVGLLFKTDEFKLNNSFMIGLSTKLGLSPNLIVTNSKMNGAVTAAHTMSKGILASTGVKIAAIIGTGTVVVGATVGILAVEKYTPYQPVSYPVSGIPIDANPSIGDVNPYSSPVSSPVPQEKDSIYLALKNLYHWDSAPIQTQFNWETCKDDAANPTTPAEVGISTLNGYKLTTTGIPASQGGYYSDSIQNALKDWTIDKCNSYSVQGIIGYTKDGNKVLVTSEFIDQTQTWTITVDYKYL